MCHLLLLVPVIGLLAFVFLPLPQALAIYLPLAVVSLGLFYLVFRSVRKLAVAWEDAVGGTGEVVSRLERGRSTQWLVRHRGELWTASSRDDLAITEQVKVISLDGIKLVVERINPYQDQISTEGTKQTGAR